MNIARSLLFAPVLCTVTPALAAQTLLQEISPPDVDCNSSFGREMDLESGQLLATSRSDFDTQRLHLFDAVTGTEIWQVSDAALQIASPPDSVELAGDRVLLGLPSLQGPAGVGRVAIRSTGDGSLTGYLDAPAAFPGVSFGDAIAQDGGRLAVGDPGYGANAGIVHLYDSLSGAYTGSLQGPSWATFFGESLALEGDRLVVGAPTEPLPIGLTSSPNGGDAYVFDLSDPSPSPAAFVPTDVDNAGVDVAISDGFPTVLGVGTSYQSDHRVAHGGLGFPFENFEWGSEELLVGPVRSLDGGGGRTYLGSFETYGSFGSRGAVTAISPADGRRLYDLVSPEPDSGTLDDAFGHAIAADGDLLAVGDLLLPKIGSSSTCTAGTVYIYDAAPVYPLITNPIGDNESGVVELLMRDDPVVAPGDLYLLLATASGTAPGIVLNGVQVPLNIDVVTDFTLANANSAQLANTFGVWGADAAEVARLSVPVPPSVGTVEWVLVSLETDGGLSVRAASAPVPYD